MDRQPAQGANKPCRQVALANFCTGTALSPKILWGNALIEICSDNCSESGLLCMVKIKMALLCGLESTPGRKAFL